ncbi:hypothetical protein EVG20_g7151 [Dentipellis fragilis]|uniref:Cytochrome c oxidase-assembly factor COX23, mitochondrial n=1 Tax=Dentipellis fragilis TaxID=205917 RepID=A0A4Y9YHW2_9AGAM|nr:hypothetical protein EVG20_g7151 [Dentipellis fragilis]
MARRKDEATSQDQSEPSPWATSKPNNYRDTFGARSVTSEFADPCVEASKASMECLNRHDYDRDKCLDFFQAYRDCKKAWIEQRKSERRSLGD